MQTSINSGRVLKNTISLYVRMIILTLISFFTVRIILESLGVEDYGLYNVVAGFIGLFAFLSGTMTISSQRYFALCLYDDNWEKLNKLFSVNFVIYIFITLLILLISETIGLWFVLTKLIIPIERRHACMLVYEFSIITFLIGLITSPFLALLVADENLGIYSVISILEGIIKICVAYVLIVSKFDKLILYAILQLVVSLIINLIYVFYCIRKYKKLKLGVYKDKEIYKEVFSFLNWNMIGAIANIGKGQGINIIMNLFFGPVVNAARGIAFQVNAVVSSFSQNFMKAVDPQITKTYASKETEKLNNLIYTTSKMSFFLLYILVLPIISNMDYLLAFWLKNVPDYTVVFTKLALIDAVIMVITDPVGTAVQATGKVKWYQIIVGGIFLFNLPIAYIILRISPQPNMPFYVSIGVSFFVMLARVIVFSHISDFPVIKYVVKVFFPILIVVTISFVFSFIFRDAHSFIKLVINIFSVMIFTVICIFFIGFNKIEREIIIKVLPFKKKC